MVVGRRKSGKLWGSRQSSEVVRGAPVVHSAVLGEGAFVEVELLGCEGGKTACIVLLQIPVHGLGRTVVQTSEGDVGAVGPRLRWDRQEISEAGAGQLQIGRRRKAGDAFIVCQPNLSGMNGRLEARTLCSTALLCSSSSKLQLFWTQTQDVTHSTNED